MSHLFFNKKQTRQVLALDLLKDKSLLARKSLIEWQEFSTRRFITSYFSLFGPKVANLYCPKIPYQNRIVKYRPANCQPGTHVGHPQNLKHLSWQKDL